MTDESTVKFPYNSFRKGQKEVAEVVEDTVRKGELAAIMAPTGFGKTSAVIYGLLKAGVERVLYLVRTINEIDPVIKELKLFNTSHSFLFSAKKMCPLMRGANDQPVEDFWEACRLARLSGSCPYYERLLGEDIGELMKEVSGLEERRARRIVEYIASKLGVCPFFLLREIAATKKFIIATYPYGFRTDIFEGVFDPLNYNDFVIVVDEAHTLIKAHSLLEQRIKFQDLDQAIEEVKQYSPESKMVIEMLEELKKALNSLLPPLLSKPVLLDKSRLSKFIEELEVFHDVAEKVRDRKIEEILLTDPTKLGRIKTVIARVEQWLQILSLPDSYLFAERIENDVMFPATPMDPAVVARKPLSEAKAAILLSGTLPPGDFVRELLGVERPVTYVDTDLMYGRFMELKNIYSAIAKDVTTRYRERSDQMYRQLAVYVSMIGRLLPGLKLVVYPSYDVMEKIVGKLPVDIPVIVEKRATNIAEVEEEIREKPDALINAVAGGKLVEGVEFANDEGNNLLHIVTLVGVPYPQPDAYTRTHLEVLSQRLGPVKARYYVYTFSTIVKIKQALGRATRSPEDRAVYFLLDYRYLRRDLREHLKIPVKRVFASIGGLRAAVSEARKHLGAVD